MYRRPKFLEILHEIREQMSREANYDVDLFAEVIRSGKNSKPPVKNSKLKSDSFNYNEPERLTAEH